MVCHFHVTSVTSITESDRVALWRCGGKGEGGQHERLTRAAESLEPPALAAFIMSSALEVTKLIFAVLLCQLTMNLTRCY